MCRLLGYLGSTIQLERLLYKPEHSLIVQSYQPREMTSGLLNADGFGIGWYHPEKEVYPYTYKHTLPIWSDINLPHLSRYVETNCILGYVRSATPGLPVDLINCQPFTHDNLLFIHNGYIENFRRSVYRPIRNTLNDSIYQAISGTTDSEHIFALIINELHKSPSLNLGQALANALRELTSLAQTYQVYFSANLVVSNGRQLVASRYSSPSYSAVRRRSLLGLRQFPTPSLYWLRDDPIYPDAVIIASEPLFEGNWKSCPENSIISVREDLEVNIDSIL